MAAITKVVGYKLTGEVEPDGCSSNYYKGKVTSKMAAITKVVGYKLTGEVNQMDVVLTITKVK